MSGNHFHVHGPHDHEVEHAAHAGGGGHAGRMAVITAILATVGALFSYMAGDTQANAGIFKNNASIAKTEASNQWAYYQSKSSKQNLAELASEIAPEQRREAYREQAKRYDSEKNDVRRAAEKKEAEAKEWDQKSDGQLHQHHRWAQAMTALQVAIAMAAIALLTKRVQFEYGVYALTAVGVVLGAMAWMHH